MQIILMIVIQLVTIVFLVFFVLHLVVPCGWFFLLVASWPLLKRVTLDTP